MAKHWVTGKSTAKSSGEEEREQANFYYFITWVVKVRGDSGGLRRLS